MKSEKQKLKEKAWKLCSLYNRQKMADKNGIVKCVTCEKRAHWKQMQAGHYVDGRNNSVLFLDEIIYPQCFKCNAKMAGCEAGNKIQYTKFMLSLGYTLEQLYYFDELKHSIKKLSTSDLNEIIEAYTDKLVGLEIKKETD